MGKFVSIKGMHCADRVKTDLLVNISHIVAVDVNSRAFYTTDQSLYVVNEESMPILINAIRGEDNAR